MKGIDADLNIIAYTFLEPKFTKKGNPQDRCGCFKWFIEDKRSC